MKHYCIIMLIVVYFNSQVDWPEGRAKFSPMEAKSTRPEAFFFLLTHPQSLHLLRFLCRCSLCLTESESAANNRPPTPLLGGVFMSLSLFLSLRVTCFASMLIAGTVGRIFKRRRLEITVKKAQSAQLLGPSGMKESGGRWLIGIS